MKYRYRCANPDCASVNELVQSIDLDLPDTITCRFCTGVCFLVLEAPAVSRAGMTHESFDMTVGKDAARRWEAIDARQKKRDAIRKESGQVGLQATGVNDYQPIPQAQVARRTDGMEAVQREGYKPGYDTASDKVAINP